MLKRVIIFFSKKIHKIIDATIKNKTSNYKIKKKLRKFARFTIRNFFHNVRLRILYYFLFKKKLAELLFITTNDTKGKKLYDIYIILENLIERKSVKKILEIGIGGHQHEYIGGETLRGLKFFFKNAYIYAIDIMEKSFLDSRSVKTLICNEGDKSKMSEISNQIGNLDLIIDDGSHLPKNQISNFEIFFEKLNDGGVYIIEDLWYSYLSGGGGDPKLSYQKNIVSYLSFYIHNTQSDMLIKEEMEKIIKYKNIGRIFFLNEGIIIQKKIKSEKVMSNDYAYLSLEELSKKTTRKQDKILPSGLHVYNVNKD